MFDYKDLEFLRKNTIIGPLALIKISNLRSECEMATRLVNEKEHGLFGIDYTKADEFEYDIRFNAWQNRIMNIWINYGDGLDLEEFALDLIHQQQNKEKEVVYARRVK